MADDIIPLRASYALSMVERITELEAEIVRLRAECDDLRCENAQLRVDLGAAYCRMDDMEGYNDD